MPTWLMVCGRTSGVSIVAGTTRWNSFFGRQDWLDAEVRAQILARDSYTLGKLTIRVTVNTAAANSTFTSRRNAAPGNQTITVGAGATGIFQDAVNTDALVSGDLFNAQAVIGAGGNLTVILVGCTLTTAANNTPILGTTGYSAIAGGANGFWSIGGRLVASNVEANTQYRFRVTSTLSNMRAYVEGNSLGVITTIRSRINGGNGNQVLSIGAGATGAFEDAVNTDAIALTNLVNYNVSTPAGAGSCEFRSIQMQSNSTGRQIISATPAGGSTVGAGLTRYWTIEGTAQDWTATEVDVQMDAQASFTLRNMFVYIPSNGTLALSTIRVRKNTGPGNVLVQPGAGATGIFEDLVNSDGFIDGDLLNYEVVVGAGGTLGIDIVGVQLDQPTGVAAAMPYNAGRIAAMMH